MEVNMDEMRWRSWVGKGVFGIGDYMWMGRDEEVMKVVGYVGRVRESGEGMKEVGWEGEGLYGLCNGGREDGRWIGIDDMGIVRLEGGK